MTTTTLESSSSRFEGAIKVLNWSSGIVLLISLVALVTLVVLSHAQVIENVSPLVLYLPPAGAGGLSILAALVAFAIKYCRSKPNIQILKKTPILETQVRVPASPILPTKKDDTRAIQYTEARLKALSIIDRSLLGEKLEEMSPLDFVKEPVLLPPLTDQESLACSVMLLGDFMGLDLKESVGDRTAALCFLVKQLEELKKIEEFDTKELDLLIGSFQITYKIAVYQSRLEKARSLEIYRQGRAELSRFILKTLHTEKRVIISSGYAQDPSGHALVIELFLDEENVRGRLLNTGEGITLYHTSEGGESTKHHSLDLEPIPYEKLEKSLFLDLITDLSILHLPTSEGHGVEKKTEYSIRDVYEVLVPLWLGKIVDSMTKAHTPQYSGSCTLRPFLILIKEALGEQGDLIKLHLELAAFNQQLVQIDFNTLDLLRISETLAKLNRSALSLDRKKRLPGDLRQSLLEMSKKVEEAMQEAKKIRTRCFLEREIDLTECVEATSYTLTLLNGIAMEQTDCKIKENNTLPPFKKEECTEYLQSADVLIQKALKANQGRLASKLARQALLSIPNPSDPLWKTKRSDNEILLLTEFVKILLKTQTREDKPILTTPNEALLYLKVLMISLFQAEMGGVPKEVVTLYALQTKMVFNQTAPLYRLTHPVYGEIFSDCQKIMQNFEGEQRSIKLSRIHKEPNYWEFVSPTFSSLAEMREDQELLFLHTFLQIHPELLNTAWQGIMAPSFDSIQNTLTLFSDSSLWDNQFRNITFRNSQPPYVPINFTPAWEPIRQLTLLRSLHHYFLFASYLVGDVAMHLKANQSCAGFKVDFSGVWDGSTKKSM